MTWCFDTSAFIEPWRRHYPPAIAAPLWEIIDDMWECGEIIVPEEVLVELESVDDDVHKWVKDRRARLIEPCAAIQDSVRSLMQTHAGLVAAGKGRSGGDPWMIVTADVKGSTVVTYENFAEKKTKIKIPDVCDSLGIPCCQFHKFLAEAGVKLGARRGL